MNKEIHMKLLKRLFHISDTKKRHRNVYETIDHILERLEEIFYAYKDKEKYGDIRMACSNFFDDYPERVFIEFYYEALNDSTKVIQFSFYPYTGMFEISGRRTGFGERKPYVITYNDNIAYLLLEQRIKEIPCEIRTMFRKYSHDSEKTFIFKNCCLNFGLILQGIILELSAILNV